MYREERERQKQVASELQGRRNRLYKRHGQAVADTWKEIQIRMQDHGREHHQDLACEDALQGGGH